MNPITISQQTARRFVLGKQGLWPGRRWKGKRGTVEALRACEAVQLDPLNVVARSQDIVLYSRVLDYKPDYLQQALYKDRQFFDYGGWLAVYPISELPYWRVNMERYSLAKRVEDFVFTHHEIFDFVRESKLYEVQVTLLTAFPGTPLYRRLQSENRLLHPGSWELCTLFDYTVQPNCMTLPELQQGFLELVKRLYSATEVHRRRRRFKTFWRAAHRSSQSAATAREAGV